MLVPKVNVVLQADKDIGSITEADIWLNCMDGNGNFLSVAAEDHTGDGHYIAVRLQPGRAFHPSSLE